MTSSAAPTVKRLVASHVIEARPADEAEALAIAAGVVAEEESFNVFFETNLTAGEGDPVSIEFCLPFDLYAYRVLGQVAWTARNGDGESRGLGVAVTEAYKEAVVPAVENFLSDSQEDGDASFAATEGVDLEPTLPTPDALAELIHGVLSAKVRVELGPEDLVEDGRYVATYALPGGEACLRCAGDLRFATYAAAAMMLSPAEEVEPAVEQGELPEDIASFAREVFSILATAFRPASGNSLELVQAEPVEPGDAPTLEVPEGMRTEDRIFRVEFEAYGSGLLWVKSLVAR